MTVRKKANPQAGAKADGAALRGLLRAIATGDAPTVTRLLAASPQLAVAASASGASRSSSTSSFLVEIGHYIYEGDTALHVAAAAYDATTAKSLIRLGADVCACNRRGAEPLHYACDGSPGSARWAPRAQSAIVVCLIGAGADPNATDKSGVAPLHRAVRTRNAPAVRALLENGADVHLRNGNGSAPLELARRTTGRGGSGSDAARTQQAEIVRLLVDHGA